MTHRFPRCRWHWALVAVLLLGFGLRIYRLGAESLWYDETVSVYLASKSLPALVAHTAGDIHPPGYYVLLHAWVRVAGSSDFAVAFPSLFFGLLLVALSYQLGVQVYGPKTGLLAAFLVTISPYNLWYSQEVRMYTLGAVLGLGLLGAVLALLRAPAGSLPSKSRLAGYALFGALGLWALYYFAFLLVAVNLMVGAWWLVNWRRRQAGWSWLARWALAQGAVLLLYAPWLPIAWRQATQPPVPPWRSFTGLGGLLLETWSALSLGQSVEPGQVWPVLLLFAALFGLGLFGTRRPPRRRETAQGASPSPFRSPGGRREGNLLLWLLAGYVFIPMFLIYMASFIAPLYHVRYAFSYSTPFYVVVAAGLAWLWRRWRLLFWLGLALIVVFSGTSIYAYHTDPRYASDDHRAAVRFLAERWRPGDLILVDAGYAYTALLTYWDGDPIDWRGRLVDDSVGDAGVFSNRGPVIVQAGTVDGDPSLGWGDPNSDFYAMSRDETIAGLNRLFDGFHRVWVYRIYDTVTDPNGVIRAWLDEQGLQFEDQVFTGESQLRVQGFLTRRNPVAGTDVLLDHELADGSLALVAMSGWPMTVDAGGTLDLALVWTVAPSPDGASPVAGDTTLFVGLFDDQGERWAQVDEQPLGSLLRPGAWPAGATIRTPLRVQVPLGTPPGRYWVEVGWYRFVDGQPVWVPWTSGERLALGQVQVVAPDDPGALPTPQVAYPAGVTLGDTLRLLGFDAPVLEGQPGETLSLDLYWQTLEEVPEPGEAVLLWTDDAGNLLAESTEPPLEGRVSLVGMRAGQVVRERRSLTLPNGLEPGVYNLSLGRRRPDGAWLPTRRGPFPLGLTYPLATVRILGRPLNLTPPAVQYPADAGFGEGAGGALRLVGYDLERSPSNLQLNLHWQALAPMATRYKVFLHLVGDGGPADIRAQADAYPRLPTTGWLPGEYLTDDVVLGLPADLPPGSYTLLLGLYDEATGRRLPVFDAAGTALGDSLPLETIHLGE